MTVRRLRHRAPTLGPRLRLAGAAALLTLMAACGNQDVVLPGVREDARSVSRFSAAQDRQVGTVRAVSLPAARVNQTWTHRGGNPRHDAGHVALPGGGLTLAFQAALGAGDSRRARITADPVVVGQTIFAMDARGTVSAVGGNGGVLWRADLRRGLEVPRDVSGGGLAYGNGLLYATTGYGQVIALDPASGGVVWRQDLDASGGAAPTVAGDLVYIASRDSRAWAIDARSGRVRWTRAGVPSPAGSGGGAGPAVSGDTVVFPLSSGEVAGHFAVGGQQKWSRYVVGERVGVAAATVSDIGGDPVIVGNTVYVANVAGRLAALSLTTGEELWSVADGAVSPVAVAGGSLFLVNDLNQLVRREAATGVLVWRVQLPYRPEQRAGLFGPRGDSIFAHYGPVLASGRLIVASSDGRLRQFDPSSGQSLGEVALPGGASSNPVVANGTLYVVSSDGALLAFR